MRSVTHRVLNLRKCLLKQLCRNTSQRGIFPKSFVQLVGFEIQNGSEYLVRRSPFVRDITIALNDWRNRYKEYYLSTGNNCIQELHSITDELILRRSQIITDDLLADEMRETQVLAIHALDIGNDMLGLDMIVRDESGNVLDIKRTSTLHLYQQHINTEARIDLYYEKKSCECDDAIRVKHANPTTSKKVTQNLLLCIKSFDCSLDDVTDTLFTLYDGDKMRPIHEVYCSKWNRNLGRPLQREQRDVVFTDLSPELIKTHKIFLVCQAVQWIETQAQKHRISLRTYWSAPSGLFRRPFGVAICDLTNMLENYPSFKFPYQVDMQLFMPCEKESLDGTIRNLIMSQGNCSRMNSKLTISLDMVNAGSNQVKPSLMHQQY